MTDTIDITDIEVESSKDEGVQQQEEQEEPQVQELPQPTQRLNELSESSKESTRLRLILKLYINEFRELKEHCTEARINNLSFQELVDLRAEFNTLLMARNGMNIAKESIIGFLKTVEFILSQLNVNCQGATNSLLSDNLFEDDIKLLALQYADYLTVSVKTRVAFRILSEFAKKYQMNKAGDIRVTSEVNEIIDEYSFD